MFEHFRMKVKTAAYKASIRKCIFHNKEYFDEDFEAAKQEYHNVLETERKKMEKRIETIENEMKMKNSTTENIMDHDVNLAMGRVSKISLL